MTKQLPGIEKLAEKNVRKWVQAKHVRDRLPADRAEEHIGPYLLISREIGSGGSEIARMVGEKLGWDVLDREIVDYLAAHYGTPRSLVEIADEQHISWIEDVLTGWMGRQEWTPAKYVHRLHHLLMLAAHHGDVVVVGRGAHYILPREHGLSVRIVAPLSYRADQIARERGISAREARQVVTDADHQQSVYIKENFHHAVDDAHMYDLVINVEKLGREMAAQLTVDAIQSWIRETKVSKPLPNFTE
ncbi:MAG: cytidylate kinase-like family protein [Fuerstiella sp.]